jgi:diguanylate cyclase (GGDEF)-like protein
LLGAAEKTAVNAYREFIHMRYSSALVSCAARSYRTNGVTDTKLSRTIASTATLRIANIHSLHLFYTPLEERFERITRLARRTLQVPVAAITLLNDEKQWFKSVAGWSVSELPRETSFCKHTIQGSELLTITDTREDRRTAGSPLVGSAPHFRAYAGFPLVDEHGAPAGTFCVFDTKPRVFSEADKQALVDLGSMAQREVLSDRLSAAHSALTTKLSVARREAMMDPLTRLWNRRGASVLLKAALEIADRDGTPLTLALLDLDNFKRINDTYGHQIGDEVLRKLGARLTAALRAADIVCRIGGDEFLVVMADTDAGTAARVAERIRRAVTETSVPTREGALPISISVGCMVRAPHDKHPVDTLLERADKALLDSKAAGRNRVRITS